MAVRLFIPKTNQIIFMKSVNSSAPIGVYYAWIKRKSVLSDESTGSGDD